jgi:hypothetical protein
MIKPYTGPNGKEMDEAVFHAEQAGFTVVVLEEVDMDHPKPGVHKLSILTTKKVAGLQVSEILRPTGFLQTFGRT